MAKQDAESCRCRPQGRDLESSQSKGAAGRWPLFVLTALGLRRVDWRRHPAHGLGFGEAH
jgi:hypothetical protein